jgi:hypothetical protein
MVERVDVVLRITARNNKTCFTLLPRQVLMIFTLKGKTKIRGVDKKDSKLGSVENEPIGVRPRRPQP